MNVILTGSTGYVGEGVLLECLNHSDITQVLTINRNPSGIRHAKLTELIVSDFLHLEAIEDQLKGFDACFYCAGISANGLTESDYTLITYTITLHVAETLVRLNPESVFAYVSGQLSDRSEKGRMMWARVKGKTENALMRLPFKRVYNFRPGMMKPVEGQKKLTLVHNLTKQLYPVLRGLFPKYVITLQEVGQAMINSVRYGYDKQPLEIEDIRKLATL